MVYMTVQLIYPANVVEKASSEFTEEQDKLEICTLLHWFHHSKQAWRGSYTPTHGSTVNMQYFSHTSYHVHTQTHIHTLAQTLFFHTLQYQIF